ncbi:MAG: sulfatase [Thermoprotei archaeon]|nr:MAG: sulfatase [Thermoprotei archaeon]
MQLRKDERPNIILIAIDTLRADHLSCYGYEKKTSPTIDEIASNGILFENAIAPGIPTHPGYTTIFTGMHPLRHRIVCHMGQEVLSYDIPTLPQYLYNSGYLTVAIDNLVATKAPWFIRGFEVYVFTGGITVISKGAKISGDIVTTKALNFLKAYRQGLYDRKPFFLFIHYWDPHTPYLPPKGFRERFYSGGGTKLSSLLKKTRWGRFLLKTKWIQQLITEGHDEKEYVDSLYDEEILYSDWCISRVINLLKELDLYDNTVIIVTSDHGEGLGENDIYYDHHGLYEWDIRVPLIISYPQALPRGKRIRELVTHEDILPTILDLAGIKGDLKVDGKSLIPIIDGIEKGREFVICVENTRMTKRAIRTHRWKLIETLRPDVYGRPAGYLELYNIEEGEKTNKVGEEHDLASELLKQLEVQYRKVLSGASDPLSEQQISLPIPE